MKRQNETFLEWMEYIQSIYYCQAETLNIANND